MTCSVACPSWAVNKAMQRARDRVRELTAQHRLLLSVEQVVQDVNMFLRGWAGYFRYGHSAERLSKIRNYVRMRIALFIRGHHRRSRHFGTWATLDGRELETEYTQAMATAGGHPPGKPEDFEGCRAYSRVGPPRQFPTLHPV
jgi:hypothetical protein